MDEKLAAIYGTGQTDADQDLQKTAAAELLVKLAEQEGIDLDKLSDEQVTNMVNELFKTAEEAPPFPPKKETKGEESSGESSPNESKEEKKDESKEASAEEGQAEKEAQAKFAEADFLGRVMAHSFTQEVGLIQKEAGKMDFLKRLGDKAKGVAGKAGEAASKAGKAVGGAASKAGKAVADTAKKPGAAAGAAGAGGLAAGFLAGRAGKKKEGSAAPSALETLVDQKAIEILKTAGYVDEEGNIQPPQVAEPSQEEKQASILDVEIERLALQKLEAHGYPVNWVK